MAASQILLTNGDTPATPASGKTALYIDAIKRLGSVNDAGTRQFLLPGYLSFQQSFPPNPSTTTDTTGKMMGLAGCIVPVFTGRVLIIFSGLMSNQTATAGQGGKVQLRYGTNAAPANGAALTGTTVGGLISMLLERNTAQDPFPFCTQGVVSGLTLGNVIWIDCGLASIGGGPAQLTNLSLTALEI